jgi:hypothetical protein
VLGEEPKIGTVSSHRGKLPQETVSASISRTTPISSSSASSVPLCFKDFGFGAFAQFSDPRSSVFINGKGYR